MKIQWKIKKKRGNFRPSLSYHITLEDFEKQLAIHAVRIESQIPVIPRAHESFCLPGENERDPNWSPKGFHLIQVPYFKTGEVSEFIRLPFRESGDYPEVEASFRALRQKYEAKVSEAYGQSPFEFTGGLEMSRATGKKVAARVTADRLLTLFAPGSADKADTSGEASGGDFTKMAG